MWELCHLLFKYCRCTSFKSSPRSLDTNGANRVPAFGAFGRNVRSKLCGKYVSRMQHVRLKVTRRCKKWGWDVACLWRFSSQWHSSRLFREAARFEVQFWKPPAEMEYNNWQERLVPLMKAWFSVYCVDDGSGKRVFRNYLEQSVWVVSLFHVLVELVANSRYQPG